ncbi:MAG: molecular chaperone HtpG [Saprospiraceae bacterium]|nr:molecular chaperone HtpG [Saprospiraceae bacterium]
MIKGNISVHTENIFPIIKKFLYSDQEIFLRELISNAVDATTKVQTLAKRGEVEGELGNTRIEIVADKKAKTLTIKDKGVGLTADEAQRYLSEVAFSSASEFLEKYKEGNIIGHFGLGFYSAFMVADRVEVISKSYKKDEKAVRWTCDGSPEYTLEEVDRTERGTDIILHISEDDKDYLEEYKLDQLLGKYCKYLPIEIVFGTKTEKSGKKDIQVPNVINDTNPLWKRSPKEITEEEYQEFYGQMHPLSPMPLFWIHLNIDYPFNLTGILYFPKLSNALEVQKNKVQLYSNQVFVTDDVKEILPEFLTLLHGVVDSPDIPLNVSRSYLQSDREVKKITSYISKKVSDKLADLFKNERENYESKWRDVGGFVKYGILSDEKFDERAREFALFQNTEGVYYTFDEYREKITANQTDTKGKLIGIYTNTPKAHHAQIQAAKGRGYEVLVMDQMIDNHFMQHFEYRDNSISFVRVDSDTTDNLVGKDEKLESVLSEAQQASVKDTFTPLLSTNESWSVVLKALSLDEQPVQITRGEHMRRMNEMRHHQAFNFGEGREVVNLVVNTNHPVISNNLVKMTDEEERTFFARHLYDLARVSQGMLEGAELTEFVKRSLTFIK